MSREVRRVPADWQHPSEDGPYGVRFVPLFDGSFALAADEWDEGERKWAEGYRESYRTDEPKWVPIDDPEAAAMTYEEYHGERPNPEHYMPDWLDTERTHYQMYESVTEGTPISPVFATPEELARWLVDNNASAFAHQTADYEHWLRVAKGGFAPTAVSIGGGPLISGVEALSESEA